MMNVRRAIGGMVVVGFLSVAGERAVLAGEPNTTSVTPPGMPASTIAPPSATEQGTAERPLTPSARRQPRLVVASNPVVMAVGLVGGSVTYAFANHVAVQAAYYGRFDSGFKAAIGGLGVVLFVNHAFDGWFVEPTLIRIHNDGDNAEPSISPCIMGGYQHVFANGLSLSAALGALNYTKMDSGPVSWIIPMLNAEVGYSF